MVNVISLTTASSCALVLLSASVTSAAPYYNKDNYGGNHEVYAPCWNKHQKQTWWDSKGNEYGWDNKANKACLIVKKDKYGGGRKHGGDDDYSWKKPSSYNDYNDSNDYNDYNDQGDDYEDTDNKYDEYDTGYDKGYDNYDDNENYDTGYKDDGYKSDYKSGGGKKGYIAAAASTWKGGDDQQQCDWKYQAKSYSDCSHRFNQAKQGYCSRFGSSGTKHGDCITQVSYVNDKCIRAIDNHKKFCWDSKYLSGGGDYKSNKPHFIAAAAPSHEQPKYEQPKYEQPKYEEPKYEHPKYEEPKYEEPKYEQPKGYNEDKGYGKGYNDKQCHKAKEYFYKTGSPTLKQCVSIACAPGQTKDYIERALYQCNALEQAARGNNNGKLPHGW